MPRTWPHADSTLTKAEEIRVATAEAKEELEKTMALEDVLRNDYREQEEDLVKRINVVLKSSKAPRDIIVMLYALY